MHKEIIGRVKHSRDNIISIKQKNITENYA